MKSIHIKRLGQNLSARVLNEGEIITDRCLKATGFESLGEKNWTPTSDVGRPFSRSGDTVMVEVTSRNYFGESNTVGIQLEGELRKH